MTEWLDRALVASPHRYCLCLSEADFHRELSKMKVPKDQWPPFVSKDAATHFFVSDRLGAVAIVTMGPTKGRTTSQISALLVHEAVHIWQEAREFLGEQSPSMEFEAYAVQAYAQRLMESYEHQTKGRK